MRYIDLYLLLWGRGGALGEGGIYKLIRNLGVGIKVLTVVLVCTPLVIALLNWNSWVNLIPLHYLSSGSSVL